MCTAHAPPGTKPYRCSHQGCAKSFMTNAKLTMHIKTHDGLLTHAFQSSLHPLLDTFAEKRYTCVHPDCTSSTSDPPYFPTLWALQRHTRSAHPPTCDRHNPPRVFTSRKVLHAHLKLCTRYGDASGDAQDEKKSREGADDEGRDWPCEVEGCMKAYKDVRLSFSSGFLLAIDRLTSFFRRKGPLRSTTPRRILASVRTSVLTRNAQAARTRTRAFC